MRTRPLLIALVFWAGSFVEARAQSTPDSASIAASFATDGLFRALSVQFESGRAAIMPASFTTLDAIAAVMSERADLRLEVGGHTDAAGSPAANQALSAARARAVADYLISRHRIDPARLQSVGYGEAMPIAENRTATGRALNRRVEFRVLPPAVEAEVDAAPAAEAISPDSLRLQIERAVREALGSAADPDTTEARLTERERILTERLALLEAELEAVLEEESVAAPASPLRERTRLAVLPFAGFYFHGDTPIALGVRLDIATSIIGRPRLQPELALAFGPDERAEGLNVNLVYPISLGASPITPFLGAGVGFTTLDRLEAVLNIVLGAERQFPFGILFVDLLIQDFSDFNRVVVGFRQDL